MSWLLAATLALQAPASSPPLAPWRLIDTSGLHVGVRPALTLDNEDSGRLEGGAGVTFQITAFFLGG